jgi:hypothetical protein
MLCRSPPAGRPFAAAFMENSAGYTVGGVRFPAVPVTTETVRGCLKGVTSSLKFHRLDVGAGPLHAGYPGMIVALGVARAS